MLSTRLLFGFSMVGALLLVLCLDEWFAPWFPTWFVLALLVMGASARELVALLANTPLKPTASTVFSSVILLVLANWAPHITRHVLSTVQRGWALPHDPLGPIDHLGWAFMTFAALIMLVLLLESFRAHPPGQTIVAVAGSILAISYLGVLGTFIIQHRWLDGPYHGIFPLAYLVATSKGSDTGAYTVGRMAGRHKLWPRVSPNKTIEGAIGGVAFGILAALITAAVTRYVFGTFTFSWGHAALFGFLVSITAQLGDLMESLIKRDCARKDASAVVPGFGGVLDVIDSLLFAAPVSFAFWLTLGT